MIAAASGIQEVSDAGLAHRDVKPSNYLVEDSGGQLMTVRVSDGKIIRWT